MSVPNFHFEFHGKMHSWYQAIGSALHGVIKNLVEKKVEALILNVTDNILPGVIDGLPTHIQIGGGKSKFDIGVQLQDLVEPPSATAGIAKASPPASRLPSATQTRLV